MMYHVAVYTLYSDCARPVNKYIFWQLRNSLSSVQYGVHDNHNNNPGNIHTKCGEVWVKMDGAKRQEWMIDFFAEAHCHQLNTPVISPSSV